MSGIDMKERKMPEGTNQRLLSKIINRLTAEQFSKLRQDLSEEIKRAAHDNNDLNAVQINLLKHDLISMEEWRFKDLKDNMNQIDQWRFEDLKYNIQETDELRFRDLKNFISSGVPRDTTFTLEQSINRLAELGNSDATTIAVVSVMPPSDTGIANFTQKTFSSTGIDVDIFTPIQSGAEYLQHNSRRRHCAPTMNIFAIDSLPYGIDIRNYRAIIFVVGNSDHHVPIVQALRQLREMPPDSPCFLEVHDSVLLNLCSKVIQFDGSKLSDVIPIHTDKDLSSVDWQEANKGDHQQLVRLGLTGARPIFNDTPISSMIFHSEAAREIVLNDWPEFPKEKAVTLFHPVFEPFEEQTHSELGVYRPLRIGTFGVPGRNKETHVIVNAFKEIVLSRPGSTLTIAGYGTATYAASEKIFELPGVLILDSPSHDQLLALMRDVDIAVQLRSANTGESSGIIPQLLANDVPSICSSVGALTVFGEAVAYVEAGCSPSKLVELITAEASIPQSRREARRAYVSAHSPQKFCSDLIKNIDKFLPQCSDKEISPEPDQKSDRWDILENDHTDHDRNFGSTWGPEDPTPDTWNVFMEIASETGAANDPYVRKHMRRYRHTLAAIEILDLKRGAILEVGTSWLFAPMMRKAFGFNRVDVTDFLPGEHKKVVSSTLEIPGIDSDYTAYNVNLESEVLPANDSTYDFVLCCEVLEHLDIDPMFMLSELNRVTEIGGKLLLTTPNVTSSRNVKKIMQGYAPHFFMQYHKDRNPYRHNLEYAPDQAVSLVEAAGYKVDRVWTANTFEPPARDVEEFLAHHSYPTHMRGDNMFLCATKAGPVMERHPPAIYV